MALQVVQELMVQPEQLALQALMVLQVLLAHLMATYIKTSMPTDTISVT